MLDKYLVLPFDDEKPDPSRIVETCTPDATSTTASGIATQVLIALCCKSVRSHHHLVMELTA